jgi:hypothetical protein
LRVTDSPRAEEIRAAIEFLSVVKDILTQNNITRYAIKDIEDITTRVDPFILL